MIKAYLRNYSDITCGDIGCIQPSAEACLQNGNIDNILLEVKKSCCCQCLEICPYAAFSLAKDISQPADMSAEITFCYELTIDDYSLPWRTYMGG